MSTPRVALVTGAARGIGRAIALRLAKDGYLIALNDLPANEEAVSAVKKEVESISGLDSAGQAKGKAVVFLGDVTREEDVKKMVEYVVQELGSLDCMIANAGICVTKPFLQTSLEDFQRATRINIESTFLCYKYAATQMVKQGNGGKIIGASSLAGKQGWPFLSAYSASKFAIRGLTQAAAGELGPHGITVNTYAPGPISTPMLEELRDSVNTHVPSDDAAKAVDNAPIQGDGTPDDVAGLVSYLVSPAARYVTGQSVSINGGRYFD